MNRERLHGGIAEPPSQLGKRPDEDVPLTKQNQNCSSFLHDEAQSYVSLEHNGGQGFRPEGVYDSVVKRWGLSIEDERKLLGIYPDEIWGPTQDHVANLVVGIFLSLMTLPPDIARSWIKTPNSNSLFGGMPPLNLMISGINGLEAVYKFLKSRNGGLV